MGKQIVIINKANPIISRKKIDDYIIEITGELPRGMSLNVAELHYEKQSEMIEKALYNSIPQGVYDRLAIQFMKRKVSLYQGITE